MTTQLIDTTHMDKLLRPRVIDTEGRRALVARLAGSAQENDLTLPPNCGGLGRIHHFRAVGLAGWPRNPLPIRPASRWLRICEPEMIRAQIFQLAACAWRCWYCFVPYSLLSADPRKSVWKTADELLELYLSEIDRPPILDLTGGSPDLAPEWIGWMLDAVESRKLGRTIYLWSDDNLSSDRLLIAENALLLKRIEAFGPGYGKVCCLKGFDESSFAFNTQADGAGFREQLRILQGYADTSIDLYLYVTLTALPRQNAVDGVRRLFETLAKIRSDLPLRTVPLAVTEFSTMESRIRPDFASAMAFQWDLMAAWTNLAGPPLGSE